MCVNQARITSLLALDHWVWVGTGEGNLITYDVFTSPDCKCQSDDSSFVGSYADNSVFLACKEEPSGSSWQGRGPDDVSEAEMRVS